MSPNRRFRSPRTTILASGLVGTRESLDARWTRIPDDDTVERSAQSNLGLCDGMVSHQSFFRGRGAYRRFRSLLQSGALLQKWYEFQAMREIEALREWCEVNENPLSG